MQTQPPPYLQLLLEGLEQRHLALVAAHVRLDGGEQIGVLRLGLQGEVQGRTQRE